MSEPASKEMEERCDHDERDHGICLHCGKQTDMNAHDYVSEESSPAPSEEMEERINRISREAGDWAERTYGQSGHLLHYITRQAARSALETLAAELGKEREADKEKYIQAALARDKQATEDRDALESIIESLKTQCALRSAGHDDLRTRLNQANQQLSQLKRELAEARAFDNANDALIRRINDQLKEAREEVQIALKSLKEEVAKNLALSASYQRQKEALKHISQCPFPTDPEAAREIQELADAALAKTPDVSLLKGITSDLQELDKQIAALFWTSDDGDNMREGKPEDADAPPAFCKAWEALRALLYTLQPDHQK